MVFQNKILGEASGPTVHEEAAEETKEEEEQFGKVKNSKDKRGSKTNGTDREGFAVNLDTLLSSLPWLPLGKAVRLSRQGLNSLRDVASLTAEGSKKLDAKLKGISVENLCRRIKKSLLVAASLPPRPPGAQKEEASSRPVWFAPDAVLDLVEDNEPPVADFVHVLSATLDSVALRKLSQKWKGFLQVRQHKETQTKKPNSFMLYCAMRRAAHTDIGETKLSVKEVGVGYKALEGEQKKKFDETFKESMVRGSSFCELLECICPYMYMYAIVSVRLCTKDKAKSARRLAPTPWCIFDFLNLGKRFFSRHAFDLMTQVDGNKCASPARDRPTSTRLSSLPLLLFFTVVNFPSSSCENTPRA